MSKSRPYGKRLEELNLQSLLTRRRMFDTVLLFKLTHPNHENPDEPIIRTHLDRTDALRSKHRETFLARAHREWNLLPPSVQNDPTLRGIRKHFFTPPLKFSHI
eukprot:Selendium_serpulae@DN6460_c0_g1_i5.p1